MVDFIIKKAHTWLHNSIFYKRNKFSQPDLVRAYINGYKQAQTDISAIDQLSFYLHMDLNNAWKQAKTNEECAKILRLFLTDFDEFVILYGQGYESWKIRYEREQNARSND